MCQEQGSAIGRSSTCTRQWVPALKQNSFIPVVKEKEKGSHKKGVLKVKTFFLHFDCVNVIFLKITEVKLCRFFQASVNKKKV